MWIKLPEGLHGDGMCNLSHLSSPSCTCVSARGHNKKSREEERVTLVVAVVTAESSVCTINSVKY